jgi:hypothetical protein
MAQIWHSRFRRFQDSCRLIILFALTDSTLADFQSWEQIATCRLNLDGAMIRINPGCLKLLVFAKSALTRLEEDVLKPWRWRDIRDLMAHIFSIVRIPRPDEDAWHSKRGSLYFGNLLSSSGRETADGP